MITFMFTVAKFRCFTYAVDEIRQTVNKAIQPLRDDLYIIKHDIQDIRAMLAGDA